MAFSLRDQRWQLGVLFEAYTDEMASAMIAAACEGILRVNMIWMETVGLDNVPCCLGDEGVRYIEPVGCSRRHPCQNVLTGPEILNRGVATCIDIACYMGALLRLRGQGAEIVVTNMLDEQNKPIQGQYHVLLNTEDGIHDYTEDLIHGRLDQCSADCA